MIAPAAAEQWHGVLTASLIARQDLALVFVGLLFLVIAGVVVRRRRRAELFHDRHLLIKMRMAPGPWPEETRPGGMSDEAGAPQPIVAVAANEHPRDVGEPESVEERSSAEDAHAPMDWGAMEDPDATRERPGTVGGIDRDAWGVPGARGAGRDVRGALDERSWIENRRAIEDRRAIEQRNVIGDEVEVRGVMEGRAVAPRGDAVENRDAALVEHRGAEAERRATRDRGQDVVADEPGGEEVRAGLVRFHRPPEGTLQLLPGRLEIIGGTEKLDAIRFVRVPGKEPVITFGRSRGAPHTHIALQSPTVSRKHAAMRYHDGSWYLVNLSKTNPVVVSGRQLAVHDAPVRLADGDQLEMGEVTFRYRERHVGERLVQAVPASVVEQVAERRIDSSHRAAGWAPGAAAAPAHAVASRAHTLTGREIEIAQLVVDRKSNRAIGDMLAISPRTVSTHLTNIFRKLDVTSRGELADYVSRHGLG